MEDNLSSTQQHYSFLFIIFRNGSQPVEKFSLKSSFANQKANMDLQKKQSISTKEEPKLSLLA